MMIWAISAGTTTTTTVPAAAATSTGVNGNLIALMALGALALLIFAGVYFKKGEVSATFSRIFGLIIVAVLGVGLGFAGLGDSAMTAGFTLLGTVAGYLAGAKTQAVTKAKGGGTGGSGGTGGTGGHGGTGPTGHVGLLAPLTEQDAGSSIETYL